MSRPTVNGQVGQSGTRIGVPAACGYNFCHYCQRSGCTTSVYTVTMIISRVSTGDFRCGGVRESERPASSSRSAFKVAVSIENADHADKADGFELRRLSSRGSGQKIILGGGLPSTRLRTFSGLCPLAVRSGFVGQRSPRVAKTQPCPTVPS